MTYTTIEKCRICGSTHFAPVIDLGEQMLATVTVTEENKDRYPKGRVPLVVVRCDTEKNPKGCGLVQMKHTYPSSNIYREYWYRSGMNQTMRDALKDVVQCAKSMVALQAGDTVLDIGCNDGTLLANYDENLCCIGIDPVENIRGEKESFSRVVGFFNAENFDRAAKGKKAKIITSVAMFYDLEDPNTFVADIAHCLADDGVWVVQMADLPEMLRGNMFDQIIHEHLEYYHIAPFQYLIEKHGLKIVDIAKNNVNGSSYRFYLRKKNGKPAEVEAASRIAAMIEEECALGLQRNEVYQKFREGSETIRRELREFIVNENQKGKKTFVYGASTKGNVILQYVGLTANEIPYAADRNPHKWGGWTIGSNIPIISEEEARKMKPDYLLVLPYYFMQEMLQRESAYLEAGGKFLVPAPHVHCLDKNAL